MIQIMLPIAACIATAGIVLAVVPYVQVPQQLDKYDPIVEQYTDFGLITKQSYWGHTHHDIHMARTLESYAETIKISKILNDAKEGDTIDFHLAGNGGQVSLLLQLVNNLKDTKAFVTMIVEAPVYSAHALLAVSGNKLIMKPLSSLMFHTTSILGADCSPFKGKKDRGQDAEEKCRQHIMNSITLSTQLIIDSPVLTNAEKLKVVEGYDVYITADEYNANRNLK